MECTTVAVDLAKDVIELAVANQQGRIVKRHRLGRRDFSQFLATHPACCIVMEACGGAHYWARTAKACGHEGPAAAVPPVLRDALHELLAEIRQLESRIDGIEQQLETLSGNDPAITRLRQVSGIGLMTATALSASAVDAKHFRSGRHLASWLGLTPREHSSGNTRHLGGVSKRGDVYVRMLLAHGARSVLARARQLQATSTESLNRLHRWALELSERRGFNKATSALANKLARIAWATWRYERDFDPNHAAATV